MIEESATINLLYLIPLILVLLIVGKLATFQIFFYFSIYLLIISVVLHLLKGFEPITKIVEKIFNNTPYEEILSTFINLAIIHMVVYLGFVVVNHVF